MTLPQIGRVAAHNRPGLATWIVPDLAARDALTEVAPGVPITADDIGRVARVGTTAPFDYYELVGVGPLAWGAVGSAATAVNTQTLPAGEAVGGHRVLAASAAQWFYADANNAADAARPLGISTGAAAAGASATAQTGGTITETSWTWTPDVPVFVGAAGQLTQTPPTAGFVKIIGYPIAATQLAIAPEPALFLAA